MKVAELAVYRATDIRNPTLSRSGQPREFLPERDNAAFARATVASYDELQT
jgi:hypothetical protein